MEEEPSEKAFDQVPDDFPRSGDMPSLLSGSQLKLGLVRYEGRFYVPGFTPPERYERWKHFEELAHFFVEKCLRNEHGKYAHLSQPEILAQYLARMIYQRFGTEPECRWMVRRTASLLGWQIPLSAQTPGLLDETMAQAPPAGEAGDT